MNSNLINKLKLLRTLAERDHVYCEDGWYSCPKSEEGCLNDAEGDECNCGADEHNAIVNDLFNEILQSIEGNV